MLIWSPPFNSTTHYDESPLSITWSAAVALPDLQVCLPAFLKNRRSFFHRSFQWLSFIFLSFFFNGFQLSTESNLNSYPAFKILHDLTLTHYFSLISHQTYDTCADTKFLCYLNIMCLYSCHPIILDALTLFFLSIRTDSIIHAMVQTPPSLRRLPSSLVGITK